MKKSGLYACTMNRGAPPQSAPPAYQVVRSVPGSSDERVAPRCTHEAAIAPITTSERTRARERKVMSERWRLTQRIREGRRLDGAEDVGVREVRPGIVSPPKADDRPVPEPVGELRHAHRRARLLGRGEIERSWRGIEWQRVRHRLIDEGTAVPPDAGVERDVVRELPALLDERLEHEQAGERLADDRALPRRAIPALDLGDQLFADEPAEHERPAHARRD